ncbi:hypothetical protein [Amycolatopsis sp. CA-230715]|uniref:hypothetical protein n=1 Tax=Amycolatopsis sp. CA-230715 TaxID=2745196 RepID=UPI001C03A21D|nr:hypothetical protein [Amycolatopsis sp. CA-230715]QWF83832.1 hypothetical protein HUW46_07275 [Amycolatopsis sp. CA-230715]
MLNSRRSMVVLVSSLGLAVAACSSPQPAPQDTGQHADPAAVAWADKVCTGVQAGSAKLSNPPSLQSGDASKTADAIVKFLASISSALDDMAGGIKAAGPPPVPNAQAVVDKAAGTLGETKTMLDQTKTKMEQAKVGDQKSLQKLVTDADASFAKLSEPGGPIKDLRANPELNLAFDESPTCRRVYGNA